MNLDKLLDIKRTITVIKKISIETEDKKKVYFEPLEQFDLLNYEIKKTEVRDGPFLVRVKKIHICLHIYSHREKKVYKFNTEHTNKFKEIKNFIALQKYINRMFDLVLKKNTNCGPEKDNLHALALDSIKRLEKDLNKYLYLDKKEGSHAS